MKRIKLSTRYAGPAGCWQPGEHEVSDGEARVLVAAGAELLSKATKPTPKPEPVEVETAEADQEKREEAVAPKRRGRRRGR